MDDLAYNCLPWKTQPAKTLPLIVPSCGVTHNWLARTCVVILLLMLPVLNGSAQAQFNWVTDGGTVTITGYTGPGGEVVIPERMNGLPVTRIGAYAFGDEDSITSATVPDSVTDIGLGAFLECRSLTRVWLGTGLLSIGNEAFVGCASLTNVNIPDRVVTIGDDAFEFCESLPAITIPANVENIGPGALAGCTALKAVTVDPQNQHYGSLDVWPGTSSGTCTASRSWRVRRARGE